MGLSLPDSSKKSRVYGKPRADENVSILRVPKPRQQGGILWVQVEWWIWIISWRVLACELLKSHAVSEYK